jgi:MFS family permease
VSIFGYRNYRLYFGGQAISLIGTWMQQVAQAWLVLSLTGDPFWLGVTMAAQYVPVMFLGLFAGVVADTLPKRQTLIVVEAAMMLLAAILAVLTVSGRVEVWMIVLLAAALGVASSFDMPVRQAFTVELVGRREVARAVALNSALFNGARVIGPAAAGLAIGAFGIGFAFAVNALSFLAVIAGLALMVDTELHSKARATRPTSARAIAADLANGLAYVRGTPLVLMALVVMGLVATVGMNFTVLFPAYATEVLEGDAATFGFLMTATGIGSLAAALVIAVRGRAPVGWIAGGAILLGAAQIALALTSAFAAALGLMVLVGFGAIGMAATANATVQLAVPDELRGRVMSVYVTLWAGSAPIGGLLFGGLASVAGVDVAIAVGGVASVIVGVLAVAWLARARRARLNERPAQVSGAPSARAALRPPKPNEVLSTRR